MGAEQDMGKNLSYCGEMVYREDRERFLSAMTAPPDRREALFALYAFNHEISKTAGVVSEPMLGQIRLQWWREAIEECYAGTPRRHAVVTALADVIQDVDPTRSLFEALIEGREQDLDFHPPGTVVDLERYADLTSGRLTELALELCLAGQDGASGDLRQAARKIGTAWAMVGLMRALPFHMRARRGMLPRELAASHGVAASDLSEGRNVPGIALAVEEVCAQACALLADARRVSTRGMPVGSIYGALSIGVIADSHLKQLRKVNFDVFDVRLAAPPVLRGWSLMIRSLRGRY
ncbi:squalene/phytoene synthase family protein [Hwanghaeella grinnelliae]|uniref:Squalene/phytoene synthase family protein n=1 Tax=Hwanghaeella grinnelliae TaxID=2500179 RepID=A0A437QXJ5_9PROT|nr:phytoene/squalene synthase family protein [Hwanghaeella grinnelliae]RVU39248.1 squalene/phytoene synthase family protein [Hwanghaeella grinnelliae]